MLTFKAVSTRQSGQGSRLSGPFARHTAIPQNPECSFISCCLCEKSLKFTNSLTGQFAFNDRAHGQTQLCGQLFLQITLLSINIAANYLVFPIMLKDSFCSVSVLNSTTKSLACGRLVQRADVCGISFN